MLYEPALRKNDRAVGEKGFTIPSGNGWAVTSQDRYEMVQGMGGTIRFGSTLYPWKGEVRGRNPGGPVPFYDRDMEYTEDTKVRGVLE